MGLSFLLGYRQQYIKVLPLLILSAQLLQTVAAHGTLRKEVKARPALQTLAP